MGVSVIVDAVINHMAAGSSTEQQGTAGTSYSGRSFEPYNYDPNNMHHFDGNTNANCEVDDYTSQQNVQQCDLVGLVDLDTENSSVQDTIAAYIKNMNSLGASGYRIDAAKHINQNSISSIISKAPQIYCFQEVIYGAGEPVTPEMYTPFGDVTEFNFGVDMWNVFKQDSNDQMQYLTNFGYELTKF